MKATKHYLENKIKNLNNWLVENEAGIHFEYAQKKQNRDYYVQKLIELEEQQLETIKL